MTKIYRKTATIKAEQFDGSDEMVDKYHVEYDGRDILPFRFETPDGWIGIKIGDFIETDVNGNHWPIEDVMFNNTYAELPVIPKAVSEYIEDAKASHYELLDAMAKWTLDQPVFDWIHENSDTFARAWVLGVWRVEETGEIVKLEAEK